MIEERFIDAADIMKRLPEVHVPGYYSLWPKALHEFADLVEQEPPNTSCNQPNLIGYDGLMQLTRGSFGCG
jgi:hypothetical protein